MKRTLLTIVSCLGLVAILCGGGCDVMNAAVKPLHSAPSADQLAKEQDNAALKASRLARNALDEANTALIAFDTVIKNNSREKVWEYAQAKSYLEQSKDYGKKITAGYKMVAAGNFGDAKTQADLITKALMALQREAAAAAKQKGNP